MPGELLPLKQAAIVLFGSGDRITYERARRMIMNSCCVIRDGRRLYVSRAELDRAFHLQKKTEEEIPRSNVTFKSF